MHELSICQALVRQLEEIANQHPLKVVVQASLSIGPLSGVVPQLLEDAFPIAVAGSKAEHAVLKIQHSDIIVHCTSCNKQSAVSQNKLVCIHCGDWQTELVSGDELILQSVELVRKNETEEVIYGTSD